MLSAEYNKVLPKGPHWRVMQDTYILQGMSIDPVYQPVYQQARDLQYQVHDAIDNHSHPAAQVLRTEMQHLVDDLEVRKNPRDIENRIKTIQHTMLQARSNPHSFINSSHADHFHHTYEQMRTTVRRFPDYS